MKISHSCFSASMKKMQEERRCRVRDLSIKEPEFAKFKNKTLSRPFHMTKKFSK